MLHTTLTYNGLVSHPGGVEILLVASYYTNLQWTSIPSRRSRNTPSCFMLQKFKMSASSSSLNFDWCSVILQPQACAPRRKCWKGDTSFYLFVRMTVTISQRFIATHQVHNCAVFFSQKVSSSNIHFKIKRVKRTQIMRCRVLQLIFVFQVLA